MVTQNNNQRWCSVGVFPVFRGGQGTLIHDMMCMTTWINMTNIQKGVPPPGKKKKRPGLELVTTRYQVRMLVYLPSVMWVFVTKNLIEVSSPPLCPYRNRSAASCW